jgi:hypothetical protein
MKLELPNTDTGIFNDMGLAHKTNLQDKHILLQDKYLALLKENESLMKIISKIKGAK